MPWLLVAASFFAACDGKSFLPDAASERAGQGGGAGETGAAGASAGSPSSVDDAGGAAGAQAADAGAAGDGASAGVTGEGASAGAAGAPAELDSIRCDDLNGSVFEHHCYVDASEGTQAMLAAQNSCANLALSVDRPGHLLVLDSEEEEKFVLRQFMDGLANVSDAWLALTCDDIELPQFTSCYCVENECSADELLEKRHAWRWSEGSPTYLHWIDPNPNGGGRCAALAYHPTNSWGWVDRACKDKTFTLKDQPEHTYRTICELELE